jgi:DNA modification methylase
MTRAALKHGYEMLGIEIDEHYYAAAVERIGRYESQGTFDMTPNDKVSDPATR